MCYNTVIMNEGRIIEFYKKIGLYDEILFNDIKEKRTIIKGNEKNAIFYGVYYDEKGNYAVIVPKINNIFDELVWIHEYAHVICFKKFNDTSEYIPTIMEAYFINMFVENKEYIINKTITDIERSTNEEHTLAKKLKLSIIME